MSVVSVFKKPVVLHIELEETMSLLVFHYGILRFSSGAVSTHLCAICHHFYCPILLSQGHVACQNFTLTWPCNIYGGALACGKYMLHVG